VADTRILHRKAAGSEKVSNLSDLEYRVWTQYLLSADDFGVMPAQAIVLQADNRALRKKPSKTVQKALETLITVGLIRVFLHQGERYVWQHDWQDWQGLRHARNTVMPAPSDLSGATPRTREFFEKHTGIFPESFGNPPEELRPHAGARAEAHETLPLTPTPPQTPTQTPRAEIRPASAREAAKAHGKPIIDGQSQRRHGQHARCYEARGLCITPWIWEEICAKWGGDPGPVRDAEVRQWADAKIAAAGTGRIGESPDAWWRKQMAADFAVATPMGKGARTTAAAQQVADAVNQGAVLDPWHTTEALARRDERLSGALPARGES
jgi:hypothetical protein